MFAPDTSFQAEAHFDIGKLMDFDEGFYDVLTSIFMEKLKTLQRIG